MKISGTLARERLKRLRRNVAGRQQAGTRTGLPELRGGGHWAAAQQTLRVYLEQGVLDDLAVNVDDVIPVCAGPIDMGSTLFLLGRTGRPGTGQVIWLDGEEIDRYPTFYEFMTAMLDYLRGDVENAQPAP